jgi:shikimate dehydrogenase
MHGHWIAKHQIDGAYIPLPVRPEQLETALKGLQAAGFAGVNVTLPHQETVRALCNRVDDAARRTGAVNTLVFGPDGIAGRNTEGPAFIANLIAHDVNPSGPALVLGAGGSARAIAAALLDAGASVKVSNRTPERAEALASSLPGVGTLPWDQRSDAVSDQALLVNATALGMRGFPGLEIDLDRAPRTMVVADIVYVPLQTVLLVRADARGMKAVGGLGMLLNQGVPGFAAWFGVTPEVDDDLYNKIANDLTA